MRRAVAVLLAAAACARPAPSPAACAPGVVDVATGTGVSRFAVEIADEPQERARGLMFRETMPRDAGMLFLFERTEPVAFWMKNTPLSLDIIFLGADGRVCGLVERATPLSLEPRPSGCPARAALEVNGGVAAAIGLAVGDRVRHPAFGPGAAWACPAG
jgi:uncharacterized membrane protein (UPF0127 family)